MRSFLTWDQRTRSHVLRAVNLACFLLIAPFAEPGSAQITFDDLPGRADVTSQYIGQGIFLASLANIHGSLRPASTFGPWHGSMRLVRISQFEPVLVQFVDPVDGSTRATTSFFSVDGLNMETLNPPTAVIAYDLAGSVVGIAENTATSVFGAQNLSVSAPEIARVLLVPPAWRFNLDRDLPHSGDAVVWDNFVFAPVIRATGRITPVVTVTPEPASLLLFGSGLLALLGVLRRRGGARLVQGRGRVQPTRSSSALASGGRVSAGARSAIVAWEI